MSSPSPEFDRVFRECLAALEERGSSALEEACSAHPDLAERLRRRAGLLAATSLIDAEPLERLPPQLGDFELLERLGAGGMGIVHLARQASTGRMVALKLVRPEQLLFGEARARFRREVELCASLHHPALLSALAVGEVQGVPWFAMELVRGTSLARLLTGLRESVAAPDEIDPRLVARLLHELTPACLREGPPEPFAHSWREWAISAVRDVARALAHAHQRGVLHRDVKPSNVLLASDGRLFLSDFGLAARPGDGSLTGTSAAVGSLPYMAPEVLAGRPAETRSDVYGLGALLYELFTLRRPFEPRAGPAVLGAILSTAPTPPRRLVPRLSPDDEAVVLRAMEREPERRYASASELALDLQRLLDGRVTLARPAGPARRLWRAARRRPARAAAALLGLLVVVSGPVGWELKRLGTAREVRLAYEAERRSHEASERHFRAALTAVGHVLRGMVSDELADVPRMQLARLAAIDRAGELFAELETDRPDDPEVLRERARLHAARAEVLDDLGRWQEARDESHLGVKAYERLEAVAGRASEDDRELARLWNVESKTLQSSLSYTDALAAQRECLRLMRRADAGDPGREGNDLALALTNLAECERVVVGPAAAAQSLAEAVALARERLAAALDDRLSAHALAYALGESSRVDVSLGRLAQARASATEGLRLQRDVVSVGPGGPSDAFDLTFALGALADVARVEGQRTEELALHEEALAVLARLRSDFPDSSRIRRQELVFLDRRATALGALGRGEEALAVYPALLERAEQALRQEPERCDLRFQAALLANNAANGRIRLRRDLEQALELCRRGRAWLEPCLTEAPLPAETIELCWRLSYLEALAACLLDRADEALPLVAGFETPDGATAIRMRYAADLWNEWLLAHRRQRTGAQEEPAILGALDLDGEECAALDRLVELLALAIDAGYADLAELETTPSLAPLRDEPRFRALLSRLGAAPAAGR